MKAILEQIVNVAFLFLGSKLKGYRTKIAAIITGVLGAWGMIEKSFPDSPATGLVIYQTDNTPGLRCYNGSSWMRYTETAD